MPKVRWVMSQGFVANFIRFLAVQKFWTSVKIWQSYREFKGGNFFWDTVYILACHTQASCVICIMSHTSEYLMTWACLWCVLRARTMQVYTLFSRKSEREVWLNLRHLHVHYAVLENAWCAGRSELVPDCLRHSPRKTYLNMLTIATSLILSKKLIFIVNYRIFIYILS